LHRFEIASGFAILSFNISSLVGGESNWKPKRSLDIKKALFNPKHIAHWIDESTVK